jgi:osmotically inducible protein OsmC
LVALRCNSAYITEEGFEIESIETKCDIDLVDGAVISSHLTVNAKIKGISDDAFQQQVTKRRTVRYLNY